jgi:hypothetical protein
VSADLAERFRKLAEENGHTMGAEIHRAIRSHLEAEDRRRGSGRPS